MAAGNHARPRVPGTARAAPCARALALLLALALASAALAEASYTTYGDRVVEHVFDNGLRLLVLERHNAPVVAVHTYVDVGSVDEHVGITGIAHMMEHMAFKGTDLIGTSDYAGERVHLDRIDDLYEAIERELARGNDADPGRIQELRQRFEAEQKAADEFIVDDEWSKAITSFGGIGLNASTSWDSTNYFLELPSQFLEAWLCLESERFQFPVFREFFKERDVVKEERRTRVEDRGFGKLIELHLATCYTAHPYGQPTIGYMSDLDHLTRREGEAFFKEHYHPGNMIVSIVGDVDPAWVIERVGHYFGDIPAGPPLHRVTTVEPQQEGARRVELVKDEQPIVIVGFHKPGASHPDDAAYDALSEVLAGGRTSRLYRKLVDEKRIALFAGSRGGLPGSKYPNQFSFFAVPIKGDDGRYLLDECEAAIYEEIQRLHAEPVSAAELERVKTNARAQFIRSLASNAGLARGLATYEAIRGDWRDLFSEADRIAAVTVEDLQRVAIETLVPERRTVSRMIPSDAATWATADALDADAAGAEGAPDPAAPTASAESPGSAQPRAAASGETPDGRALTTRPGYEPPPAADPKPRPGRPAPKPQEPRPELSAEIIHPISYEPADPLAPGQMYDVPGFGVERPDEEMVTRVNALVDQLLVPAARKAARDEIIELGPLAVPMLMMRKDDDHFTIRWEVVNCGGYIGYAPQLPSICENVVTDENPHIRWRGMWAMSEFENDGLKLAYFKKGMKAESDFVAWNAAIALTMCGSDASLHVIHPGMLQEDEWRRWEAINAVSRVNNEETIVWLEKAAELPSVRDRQEVAMAAGRLRGDRSLMLLIKLTKDPEPGVRWRTLMGLKSRRHEAILPALLEMKESETDEDVMKHLDKLLDILQSGPPAKK